MDLWRAREKAGEKLLAAGIEFHRTHADWDAYDNAYDALAQAADHYGDADQAWEDYQAESQAAQAERHPVVFWPDDTPGVRP